MTNPNRAHLTLIIDRSGSMQAVRNEAQDGINSLLADQFALDVDLTVTLVEFDHRVETVARMADSVPGYELRPRGNTRLLDAVGLEIVRTGEDLAALGQDARPARVLFVVVTDGFENASTEYSIGQVREAVDHQRTVYSWQFQFIGADESAWQGNQMGMASMRYPNSPMGTGAAFQLASAALCNFLGADPIFAKLKMAAEIDEDGNVVSPR